MSDVFCIYGRDNDSYAFRETPDLTDNQRVHQSIVPNMSGASRSGLQRCDACGELLSKWSEPLNGLVVKKRSLDVSSTYDGVMIVSSRFRSLYESAGLIGLVFEDLPSDSGFFAIRAARSVEYDAERRGTRFVKQCEQCGTYESVVGATPVYLKGNATVGTNEFVRTDLEFGSEDEKSPLLLCGESAATELQNGNLKGLELERIEAIAST